MIDYIYGIDHYLLNLITHTPIFDRVMPVITHLGDGGLMWIGLSLFLIVQGRYRKMGVTMLIALGLGALVGNVTLKPLVGRLRPSHVEVEVLRGLIRNPRDYSFPSGHTLSSFAAASVLFYYKKGYGLLALVLASLIAFSRLYLMVHYPTDVLAGILLGIVMAVCAVGIVKFFNRHFYVRQKIR